MINSHRFATEIPYVEEDELSNPYNFYGQNLHRTRVLKVFGDKAPSRLRPILRGWGASVLEPIVAPLSQYGKAQEVLLEYIDEAKISVFSLPDLQAALQGDEGLANVLKTIIDLNKLKNYHNALVLPVEAQFNQKELNFSWIQPAFDAIRTDLAAKIGYPKDKLFCDGASGFSSGRDTLENYNKIVSNVRRKYTSPLIQITKLICKKLFDFIPKGIEITFPSLEALSPEIEETKKDKELSRLLSLYDRGIIPAKEVIKQSNLNNLTPVEIEDYTSDDFPEPPAGMHLSDKNY
jgi:hypothetical protein